jgi:tyrosyl-tRNA synthetase
MDPTPYEFFKKLIVWPQKPIQQVLKVMSILSDRVIAAVQKFQSDKAGLKQELAQVKEQLAAALASDVADAETIAAAQAEAATAVEAAAAATAKVAELQALADADVAEDEAITAALDSLEVEEVAVESDPA